MPRQYFNSSSSIDFLLLGLMFAIVFAIGALTMQLVLVGIGCMNCKKNDSSKPVTPLSVSVANTRVQFLPDGSINFSLKVSEIVAVLLGVGIGSVLFFMSRTRDIHHWNFENFPDVVPVLCFVFPLYRHKSLISELRIIFSPICLYSLSFAVSISSS